MYSTDLPQDHEQATDQPSLSIDSEGTEVQSEHSEIEALSSTPSVEPRSHVLSSEVYNPEPSNPHTVDEEPEQQSTYPSPAQRTPRPTPIAVFPGYAVFRREDFVAAALEATRRAERRARERELEASYDSRPAEIAVLEVPPTPLLTHKALRRHDAAFGIHGPSLSGDREEDEEEAAASSTKNATLSGLTDSSAQLPQLALERGYEEEEALIPGIRAAAAKVLRRNMLADDYLKMPDNYRLSAVTAAAMDRHRVLDAEAATKHFQRREWTLCRQLCLEILVAGTSEAITARAHMLLASLPDAANSRPLKVFHLYSALEKWTSVIKRTGSSRFPIDQARVERRKVRLALSELYSQKPPAVVRADADYKA